MLILLFFILILDMYVFVDGILGGNTIDIQKAPFQVNYGDQCGGVLIHKKWAITTAHCGNLRYIRAGNKNRLRAPKITVFRRIVHPLFGKRHEFDYDIALLELKRNLRFNKRIQPINISDGKCGKYVYVTGWGYPKERGDYHTNLQRVKLKMVRFKKCQMIKQKWYDLTLTNTMFCAGEGKDRDACQGDSGGAAVCHGTLLGISSFGYGCGRGYPGVYTNVTEASVRQWIKHYTGV